MHELKDSIAQHRQAGSFRVFSKEDDSPVTSADHLASEAWCRFLHTHFPDDSIVSEEAPGFFTGTSGRIWFVDPIDGTRQFIDGSSDSYMLAGLQEGRDAIFGIHMNLRTGEVIAAATGCGAWRYHAGQPSPEQMMVHTPSSPCFHVKGISADHRREWLTRHGFTKPPFPSEHVHMMAPLTLGYSGFVTVRETWYWDLLAPAAIMQEAGATVVVESLDGNGFGSPSMRVKRLVCLPPGINNALIEELHHLPG